MLTVDVAADIVASGIKVVILLVSVLVVPSLLVGLLVGVCGKWMIIQLHDLCIHLFSQAALLVH